MKCCLLILLASFTSCVAPVDRARELEITRVRAHLERAEAELAARSVDDLTVAQQRRRAFVLDALHDYIVAEQYPTNDVMPVQTPIFIDRYGARCAMAAVIEATGHRALVERIARDHVYAYIDDLRDDPELGAWLADNGISLREAARVQPGYANTTATRWLPTASVQTSAQAGTRFGDDDERQAWLSFGVRIGARRITASNSSCDRCVHTSTAVVGEYQHVRVPGTGSTEQVGLLVQYDLNDNAQDHQQYLIAGPILSIDPNTTPGDGFGAEAGLGMSLRGRRVPVFGELVVSGLSQPGGGAVHAGFSVGAVW